jgi:hypothetical protein
MSSIGRQTASAPIGRRWRRKGRHGWIRKVLYLPAARTCQDGALPGEPAGSTCRAGGRSQRLENGVRGRDDSLSIHSMWVPYGLESSHGARLAINLGIGCSHRDTRSSVRCMQCNVPVEPCCLPKAWLRPCDTIPYPKSAMCNSVLTHLNGQGATALGLRFSSTFQRHCIASATSRILLGLSSPDAILTNDNRLRASAHQKPSQYQTERCQTLWRLHRNVVFFDHIHKHHSL